MAKASKAARGPISTATLSRSTSSCVLVRACAGLPAVSAVCSSTGRPASVLLRSLKKTVRPCSICSPPEASGPVLMVRKPTRSGAACPTAAGTLSTCDATPAASAPLTTVRRLTLMLFLPVCQTTTPRLPRVRNCDHASRLDVLSARPGRTIVDRMLEELVRVVGPELADVGIGLDHGVDELAALLLDLADVDGADHGAVLVEAHRAAASRYLVARPQRCLQGILVFDPALDLLERRFEHGAVGIGRGGAKAGIDLVVAVHAFDEFLVLGIVQLRRVPAGRDDADGIVAHLLQQRFVDRGHSAEGRGLAAILLVLLEELESVGAGKADEEDVDVLLELRDIGAVIGRHQRRPEILHHLAASVLEGALEAGAELVAVGDVIGDHGRQLLFEFFDGRVTLWIITQ